MLNQRMTEYAGHTVKDVKCLDKVNGCGLLFQVMLNLDCKIQGP